jgi:3-dehydroquinate synthase
VTAVASTRGITVHFDYPVVFTERVFAADNPALADALAAREPARRHRAFVVVDDGVAAGDRELTGAIEGYARAHAARLELVAPPWIVAGGEACKNDPGVVHALHARLHDRGIDRHSYVVIVGGGAVLDMAGYAAATLHRGVRTVRVPTTVLAQGDSGVGVKNGVNAFGKKNFLGTFYPPHAVLVDASLLRTLPARERVAGLAEAVKVALVRDADFFAWLERAAPALAGGDPAVLAEAVQRSAALHLEHIRAGGDPFELGTGRPLDFGHWSAHKLESLTAHRLRHGEAVAIGVALDALYSAAEGRCAPALAERVVALLAALGLRVWDDALELRDASGARRVLEGLAEFREHLGGELTVTLLADIGRGVDAHAMRPEHIESALARLRALDAGATR